MTPSRFVILRHDHPFVHWDFLIEAGDVLRAWRLLAEPGFGRVVSAERSFDHRKMYLDYEGPVSGDRGTVVRWDGGTFTTESEQADRLTLRLDGQRLRGLARLEHFGDRGWQFQLLGDEPVSLPPLSPEAGERGRG